MEENNLEHNKNPIKKGVNEIFKKPLLYSFIVMGIGLFSMYISTSFLMFQSSLLLFTIGMALALSFYITRDLDKNNDFYEQLEEENQTYQHNDDTEKETIKASRDKTPMGFLSYRKEMSKNKYNYDNLWNPEDIAHRPNT